ncbi:MAG: hypothetical protein ACRDWN_08370 [Acidimicrobiales bacterium]
MESARPARPEDLPRCRQLAAEALDGIRSARGGPELLAVRAGRPAALVEGWAAAGGDRHLLVGLIDREVVGLAAGRIAPQAAPGDGAPGTPAHPAPAGGSPAV